MKIEYRLTKKNESFIPQTRIKKILFWSSWKTIAPKTKGFILCNYIDWSSSYTKEEAEKIIHEYDIWFLKDNKSIIEFITIDKK